MVAGNIRFQSAGQSIQIGFTDQRISSNASAATFWAFLRQRGWIKLLKRCLPHPLPKPNNALTPVSKLLGFVHGLLCGAKKVRHVAYLRRDPLVPYCPAANGWPASRSCPGSSWASAVRGAIWFVCANSSAGAWFPLASI